MLDPHQGYILGTPDINTIHDTNLMYPILPIFLKFPSG
jgi:hypothetical protein